MPKEATYHTHPRSVRDLPIFGRLLEAGDTIESTDLYSSSNGLWEQATCPGLTLHGNGPDPLWIRPVPVPPERELVRVGNVYMERGAVPPAPTPADDENIEV